MNSKALARFRPPLSLLSVSGDARQMCGLPSQSSSRRCSMKPPLRTKSVGTKVSEEEFRERTELVVFLSLRLACDTRFLAPEHSARSLRLRAARHRTNRHRPAQPHRHPTPRSPAFQQRFLPRPRCCLLASPFVPGRNDSSGQAHLASLARRRERALSLIPPLPLVPFHLSGK